MKQQRSYALDLIKLLLSYVIAFFHCGLSVSPGPTVTVQVFFILSGFFLGKTFYERSIPTISSPALCFSCMSSPGMQSP